MLNLNLNLLAIKHGSDVTVQQSALDAPFNEISPGGLVQMPVLFAQRFDDEEKGNRQKEKSNQPNVSKYIHFSAM